MNKDTREFLVRIGIFIALKMAVFLMLRSWLRRQFTTA